MAPASGMGLSSETRFDFGYAVGFGRLVCAFGKASRMQEYAIVLGSCSSRESREKSREKGGSTVKPA